MFLIIVKLVVGWLGVQHFYIGIVFFDRAAYEVLFGLPGHTNALSTKHFQAHPGLKNAFTLPADSDGFRRIPTDSDVSRHFRRRGTPQNAAERLSAESVGFRRIPSDSVGFRLRTNRTAAMTVARSR